MIKLRKSGDRGGADYGWLVTRHTFSFNRYYDPEYMGFRSLRVINEDKVAPGGGFPTHPHADMEIITFVISGALEHRDSMGNGSVIRAGDVQKMSAGKGITHSEFNPSDSETGHFYQIWLTPSQKNIEPMYAQISISRDDKLGRLFLIAATEGAPLPLFQDAKVFCSILAEGGVLEYEIGENRHAWVQVISGEIELNGTVLKESDGAAVSAEIALSLKAISECEFLLFDLA